MRLGLKWLVVLLLFSLGGLFVLSLREEPIFHTSSEGPAVLTLNTELEFAAIQAIHGQLDDNADGKVDLSESSEFVETELCGDQVQQACWSSDKSKRFHQTDKQITSLELWTSWHKNKVINWTTCDVVSWLELSVGLSQYSETFQFYKITGRHLPQLAVNTNQILQNVLMVSNSQHKQKIQLRAMDVVLFGPPVESGHWKDAVLALSVALGLCGLVYALRQRQVAQSRIDSFLDDFRIKEEELGKLKSKLELEKTLCECEERDEGSPTAVVTPPLEEDDSLSTVSFGRVCSQDRTGSLLSQVQGENELLRSRIVFLESQVNSVSSKMSRLHDLLQECSRREWGHLDCRRKAAEEQMTRAQRVCDKIKKRRSSLFGTFHLANSSALEEAGLQITKAVNKMHSISECFDEYHTRWEQIEQVCGYSIAASPVHQQHNGFDREGSSVSLSSMTTSTSAQSTRAALTKQQSIESKRGSLRHKSSPESSLEMSRTRLSTQSLLFSSVGRPDSECEPEIGACKRRSDPSPMRHSTSVPGLMKPSYPEALMNGDNDSESSDGILFAAPSTKGLGPIREESSRSRSLTYSNHPKWPKGLRKQSRSSDV